MGKYRRIANDIKPALVMVVAQTAFAATNIFYKLAVMDGMNMNILIAYRFIFGSAFMLPLALFVERSSMNKLTWKVFSWSFLSGLVGASMAQLLYLRGLVMSSATFAMATTNLIPAMTFVLAITFRSEKLGWERWSGKAKVGGTLVGVVGAMTLTFYKGPCLDIWNTHVDLLKNGLGHVEQPRLIQIIGIFLCLLGSFCYASWLTMQVKINEQYPYPYTSIALMNLTASIQCTIYALCTERDWIQWKLGFNIRLFTSLYAGIFASGLILTTSAWGVQKRGPIFVSAFSPLTLVIGAIAASLLLDEKLHLGSVVGGVIIICGLYIVLWGKRKEMKYVHELPHKSSTHQNVSNCCN